jgi:pyruvate kinase
LTIEDRRAAVNSALALRESFAMSLAASSPGEDTDLTKKRRVIDDLIHQLGTICSELTDMERHEAARLSSMPVTHQPSARNLLHYLALRRHDIRPLQERLARMGLSSLGRAESHVLATLERVLDVLHQLAGGSPRPETQSSLAIGFDEGIERLNAQTVALLGSEPPDRSVRIMVTMSSEAADDYLLVRELLDRGMNCMRINCAHDDAPAWGRMAGHLRRAEQEVGRPCRILMDLPGPKMRTGPIEPGARVLKWRPHRDAYGRVIAPAKVWLMPANRPLPPPAEADASLPLEGGGLAELAIGNRIAFKDARGKSRSLTVVSQVGDCRWAEANQTAYVAPGIRLRRIGSRVAKRSAGSARRRIEVGDLPARNEPLRLKKGESLALTRELTPGKPAAYDAQGELLTPATIGCTLPELFAAVRPHERIWLDDGRLGGVIMSVSSDQVQVEITEAPTAGAKLGADKGINLPDTELKLPALTATDLEVLPFIAANADLVGYSFVREPSGISELRSRLAHLGAETIGMVLKIETKQGFAALPELLLEAMRGPSAGVMIARGDLAVECGYERLAEVQEEILWICEAAHMPVIWATQVLEKLAKKGQPTRAEITDAAMGQRAECVMLNKGPHILEAVNALNDILLRMQEHQTKKQSLLRQLRLARVLPSPTE